MKRLRESERAQGAPRTPRFNPQREILSFTGAALNRKSPSGGGARAPAREAPERECGNPAENIRAGRKQKKANTVALEGPSWPRFILQGGEAKQKPHPARTATSQNLLRNVQSFGGSIESRGSGNHQPSSHGQRPPGHRKPRRAGSHSETGLCKGKYHTGLEGQLRATLRASCSIRERMGRTRG